MASLPYGSAPPPIPYASKPTAGRRPSLAEVSNVMSINAVYYPNYRIYRGDLPASMNYNCISHVFYAFAHVAPDGTVFLSDEWADLQMGVDGSSNGGCMGSFMRLKEEKTHLKVILSVGGAAASQNFAAVAANAALRDNFARSAFGLVKQANFDGLDIDWEHPSNPKEGQDFLLLLANIRHYMADDHYILSAALPAGEWALRNIDLYKAQDHLDLINLMAYDFAGPWTTAAGHHAQLYPHPENTHEASGAAAVNYVLSTGFPSKKILLGIPAYGRSFLGARRAGDAFSACGGDEGTFEYKELPRHGSAVHIDRDRVAAFSTGGDGGFVSFDNPETVRIKGQFCRNLQLGGLFYWTGTADVPKGPQSLIESGFKALHGL